MVARPQDLGADPEPADRGHDDLSVTITPMRRRHLRGVLRIEHQVYPRPWSLGLYMGELALSLSRVYLVARVDVSVAGYAGLMVVGDEGHITTIAVDPQHQRNHIATRLMVELVRQAAAKGVHDLTLEVRMSNRGAQHMYRRFGFVPGGARKAYYVDNNEDALIMWAHGIHSEGYAARLDGIEASIAGTTRLEGFL